MSGVALQRRGRGLLAEGTHKSDDLPDLRAVEKLPGHGGSDDAFTDVGIQIGVRAAMIEDAGGEIRTEAAGSFQAVARSAVGPEYLCAGGPVFRRRVGIAGGDLRQRELTKNRQQGSRFLE